jgi:hypothetical protein
MSLFNNENDSVNEFVQKNNYEHPEPIEMIIYKHIVIFNHPNSEKPKYINEIGNYEVSRVYIEDDELDYSSTEKTKHIYYLTNNISRIPILPVYFTSLFSLNRYIHKNKNTLRIIYGQWNKDLWFVKATNTNYVSSAKLLGK